MAGVSWALTLTQPWATLVALGAKRIETRSWGTRFRGPIAIHAAKGFPLEAQEVCHDLPFASVLNAAGVGEAAELPRGAIVAVAVLADVWRFDEGSAQRIHRRALAGGWPAHEVSFGDFNAGRWGFMLADVRPLEAPIPVRGMLGLWALPDDVRTTLNRVVAEPNRNENATTPEGVSGVGLEVVQ